MTRNSPQSPRLASWRAASKLPGMTCPSFAVTGQQDQPANLREKIVGPHVALAWQCVNDRAAALQNVGRRPRSGVHRPLDGVAQWSGVQLAIERRCASSVQLFWDHGYKSMAIGKQLHRSA